MKCLGYQDLVNLRGSLGMPRSQGELGADEQCCESFVFLFPCRPSFDQHLSYERDF